MADFSVQVHRFKSGSSLRVQLTQDVNEYIVYRLQNINCNKLTIALSGGNTPLPLYRYWSMQEWPWSKLAFSLVDERLVDQQDKASNFGNIIKVFSPIKNIEPLVTKKQIQNQDVSDIEERLSPLSPFDLVILGMGEDGHTASWIPGAEELDDVMTSDSYWMFLSGEKLDHTRVSMTWSLMKQSQKIIVLICGKKKVDLLDYLLAAELEERDELSARYPICQVLYQNTLPVDIYLSEINNLDRGSIELGEIE